MDTVLIGICTFRRPEMLAECLAAVAAQEQPQGARLHVLVVDNDAVPGVETETMRRMDALLASLRAAGIEASCLRESRRGIARARNTILGHAGAIGADWVAMVDDDGVPSPGWIAGLHSLAQRERADVVRGRVIYERSPSRWVELWHNVAPTTRKTGDPTDHVATNNVLFTGRIARDFHFHTGMPLGIAEDRDFFRQVAAAGARCLYHHEAVVHEAVPDARNTPAWHVRRRWDVTTSDTYYSILRSGWWTTARRNGLRAVKQTLAGVVLTALYPVSRSTGIRGLWRLSWGLGVLRGLLGLRSRHYRHVIGH